MVRHQSGAGNDTAPTMLRLLVALADAGVEPVRHGRYLGLRGQGIGRVSTATWAALDRHGPALARLLPDSKTPFERRLGRQGVRP